VKTSSTRFAVAALAACLLGLALCPVGFIAMGALSQFPPLFSAVMLPPFLLGCCFLLWRYLSRPAEPPTRRIALLLAEVPSWIAVAVFLFFVSGFTLLTTFERLGIVSTAFLAASVVCLPVVLLRRTALERRLADLPGALVLAVLLLLLAGASAATVAYLRTPPAFI
jgi:hypothetical protein